MSAKRVVTSSHRQRPRQTGVRFSAKARAQYCAYSEGEHRGSDRILPMKSSRRGPSPKIPSWTCLLNRGPARGPLAAICCAIPRRPPKVAQLGTCD